MNRRSTARHTKSQTISGAIKSLHLNGTSASLHREIGGHSRMAERDSATVVVGDEVRTPKFSETSPVRRTLLLH